MHDVHAEAGHLQVIFHNDHETPLQFLIELLHSVFKKQLADALRFTEAISNEGQASCGTYPSDVAIELLEAARQRIRVSGHPLRITSEVVAGVVGEAAQRTKGVSAAFIKELMRRIAQASIARDGGTSVESGDIGEALDDMLFAGGKLNVKLLGGAQEK